jgi:hypothetical protein
VDLEIFLDLGMSPVADAYTDHPDDPVTRYPLELAVCDKCRLVQLIEVLDDVTLFGTGYSFEGVCQTVSLCVTGLANESVYPRVPVSSSIDDSAFPAPDRSCTAS